MSKTWTLFEKRKNVQLITVIVKKFNVLAEESHSWRVPGLGQIDHQGVVWDSSRSP